MMTLPLEGLRVVEFCQFASGPFCTMLLGDMGADVIKVEPPTGDSLRAWPPITEGMSDNFASLNRNKRSVVLDLKDGADLEAARHLVLSSDAVVENFRPGVMARLGLGYEDLAGIKPSLVYCSVSAFGQRGPRAGEGGFDLTLQALSGVMSVTGEPNGAPVKCGVPMADFGTALFAAFATMCALRKVERTGLGEHLDVSMLGSTLAMAALQTSEYFGNRYDPVRLGSAHPRSAPYQAFRTLDGYLTIAAGNDRLWQSVCRVIGSESLVGDPRFATNALRAANQRILTGIIESQLAHRGTDEWIADLASAGVPCAPINSFSSALADPQVAYMEWVRSIELPGGAKLRTFGHPVRMSNQSPGIRRPPPGLGEHTKEIMQELGSRSGGTGAATAPEGES